MANDLTEEELGELERHYAKATPGKWKLWAAQVMADQDGSSDREKAVLVAQTYYRNERGQHRTNDAEFICEVQRAFPALLSMARRAAKAEGELAEATEDYNEARRRLWEQAKQLSSELDRVTKERDELKAELEKRSIFFQELAKEGILT